MESEYTKILQLLFPIYAVFQELSKNFEAPEVRKTLVVFKLESYLSRGNLIAIVAALLLASRI